MTRRTVGVVAVALGWLSTLGCAAEPPKPPSQGTVQQIRTDADRFFEKMKEEERQRGAGPEEAGR